MTIGDVLAVTAGISLVGAAWTATILLFVLAFPGRTAAAQARLTAAPGACFGQGLAVILIAAFLAALCWNASAGPVKLLAGLIAGGIGLAAALGSAGAVRLLAERISSPRLAPPPFGGVTRAAILYVLAGFLPLLGWFVLVPGALLLSVGSATSVMLPRRAAQPARTQSEAV